MAETLTPDEMADLEGLVDPDTSAPSEYEWDMNFQREILGLLLIDKHFVLESKALMVPKYFVHEVHQRMCSILFKHHETYKTLPNRTQMIAELKEIIKDKDDEVQAMYLSEMNAVMTHFTPGIESRDYYREKITLFAKRQALITAFSQCTNLIKKNSESNKTWDTIKELLSNALLIERNFEEGENYFKDYEQRYERMANSIAHEETFTSGFQFIDDKLSFGGLRRGEMAAWMGLSGSGKSLLMVSSTIANLAKGKRVLYITLESDQDMTAIRFDAQLADPASVHGVNTKNLIQNKDIVFKALEAYTDDKEDKRLLIIKHFSGGTMDVASIKAYYSQMVLRGFKPDMVVIDYVGEIKDYPGMERHESRYRIVRDLRAWAFDEQFFLMTAMQPNRSGKAAVREGLVMDDENLGDSFAQIKPLEAMWSINQLLEEKECGLARIFGVKHRNGESRFTFYVRINPNTLRITQISETDYNETLKKYRNEKEKTTADALKERAKNDELSKMWKEKRDKKAEKNGEAPLAGIMDKE